MPNRREDFAFKEEAFPASYRKDLEVYLAQRTAPDVFADNWSRPLRPITARQRRGRLLLLATALVASGLRSTGSRAWTSSSAEQREGASALSLRTGMAARLPTIWEPACDLAEDRRPPLGRADEAHLKALGKISSSVCPPISGFIPKNGVFYRQFADQRLLGNLLRLP